MAATIARAQGFKRDGTAQNGEATRLGHGQAFAEANTWRTFTTACVEADGHGYVRVVRDGEQIHFFSFGPEGGEE